MHKDVIFLASLFYHYLFDFLFINLLISTIGMTSTARSIDTAYSIIEICSNPNALDKKGTYITAVVHIREANIASNKYLF